MSTARTASRPEAQPHDAAAERALLGAAILDPVRALRVWRREGIEPETFYVPEHETIARALVKMADAATPIDLITLQAFLSDSRRLEAAGGPGYLDMLIDGTPASASAGRYAEIVATKARHRAARLHAMRLEEAVAREDSGELDRLLAEAPEIGPRPKPRRRADTLAFRQYPLKALPSGVSSFVSCVSESIGCDPSFVALPVLATLAAAIGNSRRVLIKPGWTEPPILWAAIVGESGDGKSPAFRAALATPRRIQAELYRHFAETRRTFEADRLRYEVALTAWRRKGQGDPPEPPSEPTCPRLIVSDTTIEALAVILSGNSRGVLLGRDELNGWIASFDRYVNTGLGGDVSGWLSMHSGESLVVDRKVGRQTLFVPSASVSIVGGIQPGVLARSIRGHVENGLAARFLYSMPPRAAKRWTDRDVDRDAARALDEPIRKLLSLQPSVDENGEPCPVVVPLDSKARGLFVTFFNEHAAETAGLSGPLAATWSKLEGGAVRLALVIQLTRWALGEARADAVDGWSMAAGIELARWHAHEARRVFGVLTETEPEREARRVIEAIKRRGGAVTARDLQRTLNLPTSDDADRILQRLVTDGLGTWGPTEPGPTGGRPTRKFTLTEPTQDETPKTWLFRLFRGIFH